MWQFHSDLVPKVLYQPVLNSQVEILASEDMISPRITSGYHDLQLLIFGELFSYSSKKSVTAAWRPHLRYLFLSGQQFGARTSTGPFRNWMLCAAGISLFHDSSGIGGQDPHVGPAGPGPCQRGTSVTHGQG